MLGTSKVMTADERRWQAEDDARTIARYLEIMKDKNRVVEASKVAKIQAEDLQKRADAMKKVANKKGGN